MAKYKQGVKVQNGPALTSVVIVILAIVLSVLGFLFNAPMVVTGSITIALAGVTLSVLSLRL